MNKEKLKNLRHLLTKFSLELDIHMFRFPMTYVDSGLIDVKKAIEDIVKFIDKEV